MHRDRLDSPRLLLKEPSLHRAREREHELPHYSCSSRDGVHLEPDGVVPSSPAEPQDTHALLALPEAAHATAATSQQRPASSDQSVATSRQRLADSRDISGQQIRDGVVTAATYPALLCRRSTTTDPSWTKHATENGKLATTQRDKGR